MHYLLRAAVSMVCLASGLALAADKSRPPGTVIINAQLADGTGTPLRKQSLRIVGDRIEQIGQFAPQPGETVIDASGLVLAPGFIDMHNHSDEAMDQDPLVETQIAQGITTTLLGLDGSSPWPIGAWLEQRRKQPAALNVALMVGHATVREKVMGKDFRRVARADEVEKMAQLVDQGMREGAFGLSSGVEYDVASYASTDELVALSRVAAKYHGFYISHVRDEADKSMDSLLEIIAIAERAKIPVQQSHIKLGTVNVWHKAPEFVRVIEAARKRGVDFTADCYPYDGWASTIKVLVPNKQYTDPKSVERALADVGGAERITIMHFEPNRSYERQTLAALAKRFGVSPVDAYIRIIKEGDAANDDASVIGRTMVEDDIKVFYQQPWVMVSSDGGVGLPHPRSAGTYPRVLGDFVRERKWLTLPEAVRKMTSLPAQRLGWSDRGVLRAGAIADLVLFNPATVIDRATFAEPELLPKGIETVFVNGMAVWQGGKATGARPGRALTKQ